MKHRRRTALLAAAVFIDQLLTAGRWLLVLVVAFGFCGASSVRPQLTRRVEEAKAAQEQAQVRRGETEEAVEVRAQQRRTLQQRREAGTSVWPGDEPAYSRNVQTTIARGGAEGHSPVDGNDHE